MWIEQKQSEAKRSIADDADKIRWLTPKFGNGEMQLTDISTDFIADVLSQKKLEGKAKVLASGERSVKPVANATINRYAALIHSMLKMAHTKGYIQAVPHIQKLKEPRERVSYLTHEEASALLAELPTHLKQMARLALATGIRQDNVLTLEWENVDLLRRQMWVWSDDAKGKADISVPLSDDAYNLLLEQHARRMDRCKYVFADERGQTYGYPAGKAWKSALRRAGIPETFRWHDLRHTWATWHVMAGTPLEVLMKLGGWKTLAMVLRYAHLAQSHLASHASNVRLPTIADNVNSLVAPVKMLREDNVSHASL